MKVSHPDKLYYPKRGIAKQDVVNYYSQVSQRILPHTKNRPFVLERFVEGADQKGFFQKQLPDYFPSWIPRIRVEKKEGGTMDMVQCPNKKTLLYLVNQGCLTPHLWLSKTPHLDQPDRMIFDLDPPHQKKIHDVKELAWKLKEILEKEFHCTPFIMTTGSKGFHIIVFLEPSKTFDEIRKIAKDIAEMAVQQSPKKWTTEQRKSRRQGRVFIDILRNSYAQHSVCPYSLRKGTEPFIAMPFAWKDLKNVHPQSFSLQNYREHLKKSDPWKNFQACSERI